MTDVSRDLIDADLPQGDEAPASHLDAAAEPSGPSFTDLGLSPELCKALTDSGYTQPTGVQVKAIPAAMNGAEIHHATLEPAV